MTQVIIDTSMLSKLCGLTQPVELCDPSGKVLGRFTPKLDPAEYDLEPKVSKEELRRRAMSDKWYSTAEVLAHLRNLESK